MTLFDAYNIGKGIGGLGLLWFTVILLCRLNPDKHESFWFIHIHFLMIVGAIMLIVG